MQNTDAIYQRPEPSIKTETKELLNSEEIPKTLNELARKQFQENLLKEILFDLTVCELEGWDKKEYIKELTNLLTGFLKEEI